jgi:hypothetical protein
MLDGGSLSEEPLRGVLQQLADCALDDGEDCNCQAGMHATASFHNAFA